MALAVNLVATTGAPVEYVRLKSYAIYMAERVCDVWVDFYVSEEARRAGLSAVDSTHFRLDLAVFGGRYPAPADLYREIKRIDPRFAAASDVIVDAPPFVSEAPAGEDLSPAAQRQQARRAAMSALQEALGRGETVVERPAGLRLESDAGDPGA